MTSSMGDVTWRVGSQQETLEPAPNGQIVRGVRVTFLTSNGGTGSVFIPEMQYGNIETVNAMLSEAAANFIAVHALHG